MPPAPICVFEAVDLAAGKAVVGLIDHCSLEDAARRVAAFDARLKAEFRWVECRVPTREDADAFARAYAASDGLKLLKVSYIA